MNEKKNRYSNLTALCCSKPMSSKRLKEYARLNNLDIEDILKLAVNYQSLLNDNKLDDMTLFHIACSVSKPDTVEHLVKEGWDVDYDSETVSSPIRTAICSGNLAAVRKLIELGADYKTYHGHSCTPMEAALDFNKKEKACVSAVKLLLNAGVGVNDPVTEDREERALHIAVSNNMPTVVSCLLQMEADVNIQDANGYTPLHIAVVKKRYDIVKLLLLHSPDMYKQNAFGETPLIIAINSNLNSVLEMFIQKGYNLNRKCNKLITAPLHRAVHLLNKDLVTFLIGFGANVNLASFRGIAPLHVVAQKDLLYVPTINKKYSQQRKEMVELLVDKGANVNIDTYVASPLATSVKWGGSSGVTKLFLSLGADPNVKVYNNNLFFDVVNLNCDLIISFIEYGADYNVCNESGLTPYHTAISKRVDVMYIKSFVKHGCPFNQKKPIWNNLSKLGNYGAELFFKAEIQYFKGIEENNIDNVKKAIEAGAVVGGYSDEMKYPLHFLADKGYTDILTYLLEKQHSPNLLNDKGETPLYIAAKHGYYDICSTLLQFGASYNYSSKKCPLTPKAIARSFNHKDIVKLFQRVDRIFYLAGLQGKRVITILKNRLVSNFNEYLVFVKATNRKGDSLLATAMQKHNFENVEIMMKQLLIG